MCTSTAAHHTKRVGQDEADVQRRVAVDREVDAQETLTVLALAVEADAEERVEDLGAAAGVEQEEEEEGDVGAQLGNKASGGLGATRLLCSLGRLG